MSQSDAAFAGSIPTIYDSYLVPLIFEDYAADLAQRVAQANPMRVLETAAGTGVVTRALVPLLPKDARYTVTDLNQPMLDRASRRQVGAAQITWQQADALALPFGDRSFDAVCCQFGVMFFSDRVAGYREARRVLKPGGQFLFNVWDSLEHNDFARIVAESAAAFFPDDPPGFLARTPYGYHDTAQIETDLRKGGYSNVEITTLAKTSKAASARDAAVAFCMGSPLRGEIEARDPKALEAVVERAAAAIAKVHGDGQVSGKIQAHVAVAWS